MIKYQNNTISRLYGGNTPAYTLISGGTCVHGEYVQPSNTDLTTLTYDTPSGIIDTKTNLNASANTGVELIYSSDDTSIATVDSNGQIAPKASGTTTITIIAPTTTIDNTTYRGVQKRLQIECNGSVEYYLQGDRSDYIIIPSPNDGDVIEIDYEGVLNSEGGLLAGSQRLNRKNSTATMVDGGKWAYLGAGPIKTNGSGFGVKYAGQTDNLSERRIVSITCSGQPYPSHYGIFTSYCKHAYTGSEGTICQVWGWGNIGGGVLGKVYSVNIYQNNTLVKNYLPYQDNNGVGLKEMISGNVYYSGLNTLTFGS